MKRCDILLLLILLLASFNGAHAQCTTNTPAWSINSLGLTSNTIALTGALNIAAGFTSAAAVTNATLDIEIYDPTGLRVAQNWVTGQNFTACQTIIVGPWPYQAIGPIGLYTVKLGVFLADGSNPYFNATAATFNVVTSLWSPYPPPCLPKRQIPVNEVDGDIPVNSPTISDRYTKWSVWVCTSPPGISGYVTYVSLTTPHPGLFSVIKGWAMGTWTVADASSDCMASCVPGTDSENAYISTIQNLYRPIALVSPNNGAVRRNVYGLNANGTLNATPVPNETIPVKTRCDETIRVPTSPTYYSVAGQSDSNGMALPQGSYALCNIVFPLAPN